MGHILLTNQTSVLNSHQKKGQSLSRRAPYTLQRNGCWLESVYTHQEIVQSSFHSIGFPIDWTSPNKFILRIVFHFYWSPLRVRKKEDCIHRLCRYWPLTNMISKCYWSSLHSKIMLKYPNHSTFLLIRSCISYWFQ
jgi:hypothetical protein